MRQCFLVLCGMGLEREAPASWVGLGGPSHVRLSSLRGWGVCVCVCEGWGGGTLSFDRNFDKI